jgi:protection-of-telomeres protein 1
LIVINVRSLRRDVVTLKALREKLFFLWGELEEDKKNGALADGKPTKNKPFTCCVQEYGVRDESQEGDWVRMHKMISTTIKD